MSVSDRIAQSRSDYFTREVPARIDIRPEPKASAGDAAFFGKDGLTFRDVVDAINPLNHIPIVSDLFARATGHTPSTASKLVGGALLGGPIGFVASLASVVFESETGETPTQMAYAALTGHPAAPSQLASAPPIEPTMQLAELSSPVAPLVSAPTARAPLNRTDKAVLDLYGTSISAHDSYRKAQMLPYLRDVSRSQVL